METVTLGRTGIRVNKVGFGVLPLQRAPMGEAVYLLRKAYKHGIDFFDTARVYTDSEEKIGNALSDVRDDIIIATKTVAQDAKGFWEQLETSLGLLKCGYIDIYQFHNPPFCPKPGDGSGLFEAMLEAREKGLIRHIGITNHRYHVAVEAAESGLYDTLQFPVNYLSTEREIDIMNLCRERGVGFIVMKAMSGGLITSAAASCAFYGGFDNALPIWGIQRESELDEFISFIEAPPALDDALRAVIEKDRSELCGDFCRSCGYCLPCPANIDIPQAARMSLLLRRAPAAAFLSEEWQDKMRLISNCTGCNHCKEHCPYELDTPALLKANLEDYFNFL